MRTFSSAEQLKAAVGEDLGTSDWLQITQDRVNTFADATGDHQWIHVDVERAKKESPFGAPVAHGYLSLSLIPLLNAEIYSVENVKLGINYGSNKVRFVNPVTVGSHVRLQTTLTSVDDVAAGAVQIVTTQTLEIEGVDKPALVAETITRFVFE
ncbi:MaoC family dehydratase [Rhodococcus sp. BP-252]|uniref:MaoC family dehydratase n=1 Tax=Nocardiaceae TaxID=85025 RepID=UPI000AB3B6DE|nr:MULTISPECIES: MaoC family dehydratase [Rhodococcus]MBY6414501.1 MaoC family dehydratase [Rhodococcus sp. BP-320]MBY6419189.1 MaoC family dehydratase [Rhodococcus sp. BP-321]MBY6423968.1 MaoC family dehydratase [Rhodococcus sp. BP-324]MBY6429350.1 MaoC family dehydratase [Rhodococcus sp. BP-323]MBY6434311.1 MaoC family dehydratase [Rhodococcus sp. BP-322]